jgi:plasmid stabilization system protein ParE
MARLELLILLAAEREIQSIYQHLEERREGLGHQWLNVMERALQWLQDHPEIAPLFLRGYRRLLIRSYHLGISYKIDGRRIVIADVLDLRQDPSAIRRRLRE